MVRWCENLHVNDGPLYARMAGAAEAGDQRRVPAGKRGLCLR